MWDDNTAPGPFAAFVSRAPMTLTVSKGIQRTILVPEVAELSPQDFAKLYRVNTHPCLAIYDIENLGIRHSRPFGALVSSCRVSHCASAPGVSSLAINSCVLHWHCLI